MAEKNLVHEKKKERKGKKTHTEHTVQNIKEDEQMEERPLGA